MKVIRGAREQLLILLILSLWVTACISSVTQEPTQIEPTEEASGETPAEEASGPEEDDALRAAVLLPGSANDQSWSQLGYEGIVSVGEVLGAETAYSENVAVADAVAALRDYASRGFQLIVTHGGQYEEAVLQVAEEYPDTQFVVIAGSFGNDTNVSVANPIDQQIGYTRGYVSARLSQEEKIGLVTHLEGMPVMIRVNGSWRMGAQAANPDIETCVTYLEDGEDVAAGREAALAIFESGADIVESETNRAAQGVIDAAVDYSEQVDYQIYTNARNQEAVETAPDLILSSVEYGYDTLYPELAQRFASGELGGTDILTGYHTPGAGFEILWTDNVPQEILDEIERDIIPMFEEEPWIDIPPEMAERGCN